MKIGEYKFKVGDLVQVKVTRMYYRSLDTPIPKGTVARIDCVSWDYGTPYTILTSDGIKSRGWSAKQLMITKELI